MILLQIQAKTDAIIAALTAWVAQSLPQFLTAIVLLIGGFWVSSWIAGRVGQFVDKSSRIDVTLRGVLMELARYATLMIFFIAVLGQLGIETTSMLAALGAAGLAIGLALQGTLANIASGVMLLWLRPFRVGDYIDAGGVSGTVKEIALFATELHSWDGVYQFVPNSELWNKRIVNYTRLPARMVEVKYGIAYDDDIAKGKDILMDLATNDSRVRSDPAAQVFVSKLGDSAIELSLRAWVATPDYWPTTRAFNEQGKIALEAAGLTIPFPQQDVHHHGLPELPSKAAPAEQSS